MTEVLSYSTDVEVRPGDVIRTSQGDLGVVDCEEIPSRPHGDRYARCYTVEVAALTARADRRDGATVHTLIEDAGGGR